MDWKQIRNHFPMTNRPEAYFDNAATMFKPLPVADAVYQYLTATTANAYRGDYQLSADIDVQCETVRASIARFINASPREIVFTSGASHGLNLVAYGLGNSLEAGDEILLTAAEHASNILPWFNIAQRTGAVIKYIDLDENKRLTAANLAKVISDKTRIVSIAHVTNVLGYLVDVASLAAVVRNFPACRLVVDAAQSIAHYPCDVVALDCDFLLFSGHKIGGPTGIGVLYGRYQLLERMEPLFLGGGMNSRYDTCGSMIYLDPPRKFEAGTPNIEGIIGLGAAIDFWTQVGVANIAARERELYLYAFERLKALDRVKIYNPDSGGIITFNIDGLASEDVAGYYNHHRICVRAGQHCAKILMDYLGTVSTIRVSLAFYNTFEEIDRLVAATRAIGDAFSIYQIPDYQRQLLMDHCQKPCYYCQCLDEVSGQAQGRSCVGDQLSFSLGQGDRVEVVFSGHACAIATAAASLVCQAVNGLTRQHALNVIDDYHRFLEGSEVSIGQLEIMDCVRKQPQRMECAKLFSSALEQALKADSRRR